MEAPNKRAGSSVDAILDELNYKKEARPVSAGQLDDILAELGLGGKPAGKPQAPAAQPAAPVQQQPAAPQQMPQTPAQPPAPQQPPGGEWQSRATGQTQDISATLSGTRRLPIWNTDSEFEPAAPRTGKAAALDLVQEGKFVGDEELSRWFDPDASVNTTKRAQKKAERDRRKQLAAEDKEARRRAKAGYDEADAFAEPENPSGEVSAFDAPQRAGTRQATRNTFATGVVPTDRQPQPGAAMRRDAADAVARNAGEAFIPAGPADAPAAPLRGAGAMPRVGVGQAVAAGAPSPLGEAELFSPARVAEAEKTQRAAPITAPIHIPPEKVAEAETARREAQAQEVQAQLEQRRARALAQQAAAQGQPAQPRAPGAPKPQQDPRSAQVPPPPRQTAAQTQDIPLPQGERAPQAPAQRQQVQPQPPPAPPPRQPYYPRGALDMPDAPGVRARQAARQTYPQTQEIPVQRQQPAQGQPQAAQARPAQAPQPTARQAAPQTQEIPVQRQLPAQGQPQAAQARPAQAPQPTARQAAPQTQEIPLQRQQPTQGQPQAVQALPAQAQQPADGRTAVFDPASLAPAAAASAAGATAVFKPLESGAMEPVAGAGEAFARAGGQRTQVVPDTADAAAPARPAKRERRDTLQYDIDKPAADSGPTRVPTAAYTQEFDADGKPIPPPENDRSLFLDDMVDDRFRAFFEETAVVDREDYAEAARNARAKKKAARKSRTGSHTVSFRTGATGSTGSTGKYATHSSLTTGEFTRMAEQMGVLEDEDEADDYNRPQDASAIENDISLMRKSFTRRAVLSLGLAVLLAWLSLGLVAGFPVPAFVNPAEHPIVFGVVYLSLLLLALGINIPTVSSGLLGLFEEPVVDSSVAVAGVVAALQGIVMLINCILKNPLDATPFGAIAALLLAANAFGKRLRTTSILENFRLASAGIDHSAAYVLDGGHEIAYNITKGLEEENPTLLVSRPTALVKGFLRQSFSMRQSDVWGRYIGWGLLAAGLVAGVISFVITRDMLAAISSFAGLLCFGAPLSSTLVSAVPSLLLQQGASKVGAVVPGWSAIEELGYVNVVMAGAKDVFPPSSVTLKGIKTFEKVRVDLAILYAASVLAEGCDTLRGIFMNIIQNKSDMLYKVENLLVEQGRGFTAWVQNSRLVIGTRDMMQKHDIDPPPIEIEMKYTKNGHVPVYLAVSGRLFAMFIIQYTPDEDVQATLDGLIKSGVSLLVTSDDPNVTSGLIEEVYQLPEGVVKVLGRRELELLEPLRTYLPESEGVMTHIGTFTSFIGGMRAAAGCAAAEHMSGIVQLASVALACILCLVLVFSGGLSTLSLSIILLFQLGWTVLISAMPFARRY